jgi:HAMP domain-containing protein
MNRFAPGIRTKLISIFILIKVLPLIALAWFAWDEITKLTNAVEEKSSHMIAGTHDVVKGVSDLSTKNSIQALDIKSREAIERLTTDTARAVAAFLYDRDSDITLAAKLPVSETQYKRFMASRFRPVTLHAPWVMDDKGERWTPEKKKGERNVNAVTAQNEDNRKDFHYRPAETDGRPDIRPLYLEMTFIDLSGNEIVKVGSTDRLAHDRRNVADSRNTYCRAETYFKELKKLQPGDIYVSEVIGPYVKGHMIGIYNRVRAEKQGIPFAPEKSGYAGKENPVGIRFEGLVRWGTPVLENDRIIGYVTLALDHTHIMEFTDHVIPTEERYSAISDAGSGNYAFMWDFMGRNISHARDYFIVGYDPLTGEQAVPWLDEEMYALWQQKGESMSVFASQAPQFKEQALAKKPAATLTREGFVGLDCRYLNFAPQCSGWHNLTQDGGSGSFLIFWSGLWKLTTAATIPYYTGMYGASSRGFGYVTIGANVDEFHSSAMETASAIQAIEADYILQLEMESAAHRDLIHTSLNKTFRSLSFYTGLMIILVILIAIFMAGVLTKRITTIVQGFRRFQKGERCYRLDQHSTDEMGQLARAYNEMADDVQSYIKNIESATNQLEAEIAERRKAQEELSRNRDNLEMMVRNRTKELEIEIAERKRFEKNHLEGEKRLKEQNKTLMQLAGRDVSQGGDLNQSLKMILPMAAATLAVDRCSVLLNDSQQQDRLYRITHITGIEVDAVESTFPVLEMQALIDALQKDRMIASENIFKDSGIKGSAKTYLQKLGVRSWLIAGVFESGHLVGAVIFSQIKEKRRWRLDEINFANSIAEMIGLAMEAAKHKEAIDEKEQLAARLRRAEKMEALGTLAGGVAHDLNNILSGIVSYPEFLLMDLPEESNLRQPMQTILKSGKRAAAIVQDLLTLARRG